LPRKSAHPSKQRNKLTGSSRKRRQHFVSGDLAINPSTSVFINCPFDAEFAPRFHGIIFAVTCCGFLPRSALETGNTAESRMDRIGRAVFSSKYSIHDLSRCRGEGTDNIARFNMPMELGIAHGIRIAAGNEHHDWAVLIPAGHLYARFISDLAGNDPLIHDDTIESVVSQVIRWLATRPDAVYVPTPAEVLGALPRFEEARLELTRVWRGEIPWADLILAARECVPG